MDHIGIDVHKKESQICTRAKGGELIERRVRTEPRRFADGGLVKKCVNEIRRRPSYRLGSPHARR
ncbi:MAG TPA: hypothetical protein VKD25_11190 [Burkholderiales bacterium]|nr:hypothetical protein [Burkholderiales bacterium]